MSTQVKWLPIPTKEHLELPVSQGAVWGDLIIMTELPQQTDGTMNTGSIQEQSRQVMTNLQTQLEKAGSSLSRVLSITVYLTDYAEFDGMASVWREFYPNRGPGRTSVGVAALAPGLRVEMTAYAARGIDA